MNKKDFNHYIVQIETIKHALKELSYDIEAQINGKKVNYFIDWDSLFGFILRGGLKGTPIEKAYGQRLTQNMVDQRHLATDFFKGFSPYTFFEFLDSVINHVQNLEDSSKIFSSFQKNKKAICEADLDNLSDLATSTNIAAGQLRTLRVLARTAGVQPYIDRAEEIFGKNGVLSGLKELGIEQYKINDVDLKFINISREKMWEIRSVEDSRNIKDKEFHYLIDVLNIMLSVKLSRETNQDYRLVTGLSRHHAISNEYTRHPLVPHFWTSAKALISPGNDKLTNHPVDKFPPPEIFVNCAYDQAEILLKILSKIDGKSQFPLWARDEIFKYYKDYFDPLNNPSQVFTSTIEENEELKNIMSSEKLFKMKVDEERQKLLDAGRHLASHHSEIIESDLMDIPDIDQDPVFDVLIRKFYL